MSTDIVSKINYLDSLTIDLQGEYEKGHLPGFVASVFTSDSIYFMHGFGYADLDEKRPINEHTIQSIASISKTLIAVALMKAVEDDVIGLNDEINTILPFKVINPNHKDKPITIRQLATHTSSISDDGNYDKAYVFSEHLDKGKFQEAWAKYIDIYNTNDYMPFDVYLQKVFAGDWQTTDNFLEDEPGTSYDYSNIGAALLAYCIQIRTGIEYKQYTQELILDPLQMKRSGWDEAKLDQENHIVYYNEMYNAVPSYACNTYPDGGLFTTVSDLTSYLQEMMKGYQGEPSILKPESYQVMMKNQIPQLDSPTGIIWDLDNTCCIGHGGNDFGVSTLMFFNPSNGIGKILFSNISIEMEEQGDQFYSIFNRLFTYDSKIEAALHNRN